MSDSGFASWLLSLIKDAFEALWLFLLDIFVAIADVVLGVIADAFVAIPAPDFLTQYSLQNIMSGIDPGILYFASGLHLGDCFAVLSAGFAFRMIRKVATLFQW